MRALELGTAGEMRERLNGLVLAGKKTATTGLLAEYVEETEGLEFEGERLALAGNDGDRVATIEITGVELAAFGGVTWEHATAEGEGDRSLDEWRAGHMRFWEGIGTPVDDDTPLVCLRFRLVPPPSDSSARGRQRQQGSVRRP
ncbi:MULTISPECIES: ASCH domain-containing protein [unclassified Streptomyces]|uniref:ASCH domain-containing protein n=1 Tax=unclassified Streptomyces TaxID=2593676 RepID=UPI00234AE85B|nr:ASCH domain-containing protein [Streptomyces sp. M92]WCN05405.1 ASCH domain-containing protein [Streptomyces sp. M92]